MGHCSWDAYNGHRLKRLSSSSSSLQCFVAAAQMDRALCSRFLISLKNELHLGSEGLPEGTQFQTVLPVHDARWSASWSVETSAHARHGEAGERAPFRCPWARPSLWLQAQWPVWIQSACSSWGRQNEKFFCREREEIINAFTHPGLLGQGFLLLLLLLQNQYVLKRIPYFPRPLSGSGREVYTRNRSVFRGNIFI